MALWLGSLASVSLALQPRHVAPHRCASARAALSGDPATVLVGCASRAPPAAAVLVALKEAACTQLSEPAAAADVAGEWELIFTSAAAKLPFIDGYMPNRETLRWDLAAGRLQLEIETFGPLPPIRMVGEALTFDEGAQVLRYVVGEKPPSEWRIFFLDRASGVIAAESSVTGLNVIRRLGD